jgi:DNA repair photolyase
MSFTTDPYQQINQEHQLTRQCIEILHENEIAVNILTKGIITDFDLLAKRPDLSKVGVTLTTAPLNEEISKKFEPNAPTSLERLVNLNEAKDHNIYTWVSLEPARSLEDIKKIIAATYYVVDHYKLGKWNYDPRAKDINWYKFVAEVIEQFEKYGCDYYIKEDLRGYVK